LYNIFTINFHNIFNVNSPFQTFLKAVFVGRCCDAVWTHKKLAYWLKLFKNFFVDPYAKRMSPLCAVYASKWQRFATVVLTDAACIMKPSVRIFNFIYRHWELLQALRVVTGVESCCRRWECWVKFLNIHWCSLLYIEVYNEVGLHNIICKLYTVTQVMGWAWFCCSKF
jgi:hypothetical protein